MRAVVAAVAAATLAATQPTAWPAAALCLVWVAWRCISSVWRRARYLAQRHDAARRYGFLPGLSTRKYAVCFEMPKPGVLLKYFASN